MGGKSKKGYLYLIEVSRWPNLHKIGITQNPKSRFLSFEESNPKGNTLLRVIHVRGHEKKEAWIKDYFSNRARFFRPFRDNGATEVFAFTWFDLAIIVCRMEWWALMADWKYRLGWYGLLSCSLTAAILIWFPWVIDLVTYLIKEAI